MNDIKLTKKQEVFCLEYLIDLNATQAAIRAGYSKETANRIASQNLLKLDIQRRIAELKKQRSNKLGINADYILKRLYEIDNLDVADIVDDKGEVLPINQWPESWRKTVNSIEVSAIKAGDEMIGYLKKVRWPDKIKNLELLGRHIAVDAFREKGDVVNEINANFQINMIKNENINLPFAYSEDDAR